MKNIFTGKQSILEKLKKNFLKKKDTIPTLALPTKTETKTPRENELTYESDEDTEFHFTPSSHPQTDHLEKDFIIEDPDFKKRAFQSVNPTSKLNTDIVQFRDDTKVQKRDSQKFLTRIDPSKPKEQEFDNINELSENLRFSVNNKLYADVIIRVGATSQIIHAHRAVLAARSNYFHTLFNQQVDLVDKTTGMIKLDKTDIVPEVFLKCLEFIYTGVIRLKQDDVLDILALAEELGIPTLKEMCSEFIQKFVDVENSSMLLEFSREFNCQSLIHFTLKFIDINISRVLGTKGFVELSEEPMIQIICREELMLIAEEEIDIFHGVLRWSKNRYNGPKDPLEVVNKELKYISKNAIQHIRFPLMTSEQISSIVEPTNFVPQELLFEAYKHHLTHGNEIGIRFTQRQGAKLRKKDKFNNVTNRGSPPRSPLSKIHPNKRQNSSFIKEESPVKKLVKDTQVENTPKREKVELGSPQFFSPNTNIYNI